MTTRVEMLKGFPNNMVVAEAGVRWATYSKYLLSEMKPSKLYLMDMMDASQPNQLAEENENVEFVLGKFDDTVDSIPDIDMLYLDGEHDYDSVARDLETFKNKVGRWLCGHDWIPMEKYKTMNLRNRKRFQVQIAVEHFLRDNPEWQMTFITDDLSNLEHDPDAEGGNRLLYSFVLSKTKKDHDYFLRKLND